MSLEEIMRAEQASDAAKVELEARVEMLLKELAEESARTAAISEQLRESENKREHLEAAHKRLKESHKDEITRLLSRLQSQSSGEISPVGENEDFSKERGCIKDNFVSLKFSIEQLKQELLSRESIFQEQTKDSEAKIGNLKNQIHELTEKNSQANHESDKLRKHILKYEETIELMNTEASTWRDKLKVLENEKLYAEEDRNKAYHTLELKENEFLKLESKFATEMAKVAEEIEKSFEEAEKAYSDKKAMQEELETLQTSTSYLNTQLEEKNFEITALQAKVVSLEQLLLKFEGVNETDTGSNSETVRQLNQKLEEQMAANQRFQHEIVQAKQQLMISENSTCQFKQTIHDLMSEGHRLSQRLSEAETEIQDKDREIEELVAELKQLSDDHGILQEEYAKLQTKLSSLGESENLYSSKKVQELERLNTSRVNEIVHLNERIHSLTLKNSAFEQENQTLKQSSTREIHDMQSKIRSLKEQNNMLIDIKKEKELEISNLTKETDHQISLLKERVEDLNTMCESLEHVQAMDNPSKSELAEQITILRKKLQERKDAKGDPIAMAQEIKQLKNELNKRTIHNKKLLESNNQLVNQYSTEIARFKRMLTDNSKHLGVNQETLKAKQVEIYRHKEEIRLLNDEKMGYIEEIRSLRNQIQMAMHQNNWPNESHNYFMKEIQVLKQLLADKERMVADLTSESAHSKDRVINQYRQHLEQAQHQLKQLEQENLGKQRSIGVLKARLIDLGKQFNVPIDPMMKEDYNDRDLIYKSFCDIIEAMKLLKEFSNDESYIERAPEDIKSMSIRLIAAIRDISVTLFYAGKREQHLKKGG